MEKSHRVEGLIDPWIELLPDGLIPEILEMVFSAWAAYLIDPLKPNSGDHEVNITRRFKKFLLQYRERHRDKVPVSIERESVEDDPITANEVGRIDIKLRPGLHGHIYFAFECKRLNVIRNGKRDSQSTEYVNEGMMRFITEQYAPDVFEGGMIGYVMNGDVKTALTSVNASVLSRCRELMIDPPTGLRPSSHFAVNEQIKETQHNLPKAQFTIHHIFLPVTA